MTPAWFKSAKVGDKVVCVHESGRVARKGETYTINRIMAWPNLRSPHGPYNVGLMIDGDRTTVYDPRSFRPLSDISWAYDILQTVQETEPA